MAAYRFLHNDGVEPADILQPHREALVERCRLHSTVLLVQDTTSLNFTSMREVTSGLGPLKQRSNAACGLWVHAQVAFTPGRRPLGVSGLETWAAPGGGAGGRGGERRAGAGCGASRRAGSWGGPARPRG